MDSDDSPSSGVGESENEVNNTCNGDEQSPPLFDIEIIQATKDGENVNFTLKTTQVKNKEECKVRRQYEDFEWLHHCITTNNDVAGVILPPLPSKPLVEPKSIENKTKQQLGKDSKMLIGDEFHLDCRNHQLYISQLARHQTLGKDGSLQKFLTEKEPAVRAKLKRGLVSKFTSAVGEVRKGSHKDIDDYFQKERDWANEYSSHMKDASRNFTKMVFAQQRLAVAYSHLCASLALNMSASNLSLEDDVSKINKLLVQFSEGMEFAKKDVEASCDNDLSTLGFQLDLYDRFMEAEKEMLFRRTCLLVDYENANKSLDKAKPAKRQAAEDARTAAEKAFEKCSEVAKEEIKSFHHQRVQSLKDALSTYAEAKAKTARDTYSLLEKTLSTIKQMD